MQEKIEITDNDIDEIEKLFDDVKFDDERRDVIKSLENIEVEACPGSGKTTVLVAKIAILARKWPYSNKGVCILSHTNAAREEIERKLGDTQFGRNLLNYPHFVGTIHSFFDMFVFMPWLRSRGIKVSLIDSDKVLKMRYRKLNYGSRIYLERNIIEKYERQNVCEVRQFDSSGIHKFNISCSKDTDTYKDINKRVKESLHSGYFTYNEVLTSSDFVLDNNERIAKILQTRFPFVFIDEAQDTSEQQWNLIDKCFGNSDISCVQEFGDKNQAIYNSFTSSKNENINRGTNKQKMTISSSYRFDEKIAKLVEPVAADENNLIGEYSKYNRLDDRHTIFLFSGNADKVLPAYAELLLDCFSDSELNSGLKCHAVGMVHKPSSCTVDHSHYPKNIANYWPQYNYRVSSLGYKPDILIDYFRYGRCEASEYGDKFKFTEQVIRGISGMIDRGLQKEIRLRKNGEGLFFEKAPIEKQMKLRQELVNLIQMPFSGQDEWNHIKEKSICILRHYFGIVDFDDNYIMWKDDDNLPEERTENLSAKNIYTYSRNDGRSVDIHVGSIHSVKGETHLATLVLDTFWYNRNFKEIMPWLIGTRPKEGIDEKLYTRLKCHYVALSRARALICMAIPRASLSEGERTGLEEMGWRIVDLDD